MDTPSRPRSRARNPRCWAVCQGKPAPRPPPRSSLSNRGLAYVTAPPLVPELARTLYNASAVATGKLDQNTKAVLGPQVLPSGHVSICPLGNRRPATLLVRDDQMGRKARSQEDIQQREDRPSQSCKEILWPHVGEFMENMVVIELFKFLRRLEDVCYKVDFAISLVRVTFRNEHQASIVEGKMEILAQQGGVCGIVQPTGKHIAVIAVHLIPYIPVRLLFGADICHFGPLPISADAARVVSNQQRDLPVLPDLGRR